MLGNSSTLAAAESMVRLPVGEVLGQSVDRLLPERFCSEHQRHIQKFGQTGVTSRAMNADGELPRTKPTSQGTEAGVLVEDEDQVRPNLRSNSGESGVSCTVSLDGETALAISQELGDVQLTVTDVVMPQMGGRELAERVISARPSLPVLFMWG